jgi:tRNA pseudouridine55 synthase
MPKKKNDSGVTGILLYAKESGRTSFQSLFDIKKALGTTKVGHTGTLDSFADGLLVVLSGKLTSLVNRVTDFDKTYEAVIKFGSETDTLESGGKIIKKTKLPKDSDFFMSLSQFEGKILQKPPVYSALHVDGMRASDLMRQGEAVDLPEREVTVHSIEVKEILTSPVPFVNLETDKNKSGCSSDKSSCGGTCETCALSNKYVSYALIRFHVSKGTYIRSLARDIGKACGSSAHLVALRRTQVGPFNLKDAANYQSLPQLDIRKIAQSSVDYTDDVEHQFVQKSEDSLKDYHKEIQKKLMPLTPELAQTLALVPLYLKSESIEHFFNGKPLYAKLFESIPKIVNEIGDGIGADVQSANASKYVTDTDGKGESAERMNQCERVQIAVFVRKETGDECVGLISYMKRKFHYEKVFGRLDA